MTILKIQTNLVSSRNLYFLLSEFVALGKKGLVRSPWGPFFLAVMLSCKWPLDIFLYKYLGLWVAPSLSIWHNGVYENRK